MLHGNPQACERALAKAGLGWDDMAVIEVNEAFASVVLQFVADAGLEDRLEDVNPNGGGISLGHPLGATGARITATLLNELERRDARYGIARDVHRLRPGDCRRRRAAVATRQGQQSIERVQLCRRSRRTAFRCAVTGSSTRCGYAKPSSAPTSAATRRKSAAVASSASQFSSTPIPT